MVAECGTIIPPPEGYKDRCGGAKNTVNSTTKTIIDPRSANPDEVWTTAGLVHTNQPVAELHRVEAEQEAKIGEPAPMALFGFAIGTFLIAMVLTGEWPTASLIAVVPALLWFAGVGQFIGGLFALARGSTFGATAFCAFGMGNIIAGTFIWMQTAGLIPMAPASMNMLGLALMCLGYIALMLTIASLRTNASYTCTVAALVPGYVLAAVPDLGGSATIGHIGGWFLVLAAVLAFYAGGAVVVNSQWQREVLPLGKFGA